MKPKSRLILYILINILVSAATTLTVLWIWERTHPAPEPLADPLLLPSDNGGDPEAVPPTATLPPFDWVEGQEDVIIHSVVGAGNLAVEYVEIRNQSTGAVDLSGWQLRGGENDAFTFPAIILNEGGAVKVYSKAGNNTVIELYWQAETPVWQPGKTVSLLDAGGTVVSTYSIP